MQKKTILIKKILVVFCFLFVCFLISLFLRTQGIHQQAPPTKEDYQAAISAIHKKLPVMLDAETRFDSVMLRNKTIFFQYTLINKKVNSIDVKKLRESLRKEVHKTYCAQNDTMRLFRDNGYSAHYSYIDKEHNEVLATTMIPQDCF